jgi:hypothetical protein
VVVDWVIVEREVLDLLVVVVSITEVVVDGNSLVLGVGSVVTKFGHSNIVYGTQILSFQWKTKFSRHETRNKLIPSTHKMYK